MMLIRPETPQDYAALMRLHYRAFGERMGEAVLVALLRQRQAYDPELSLVAETDGEVTGHAMFNPTTIRLLGQDVRAVSLAPIGIEPAHQKQGIGAALIEEGHRVAREKGFLVSYLLGHVEYYPRFGYLRGMYGVSSVEVASRDLNQLSPTAILETRPVQEADIPTLQALWQHEEAQVDFAAQPESTALDWISPNPQIAATVYLQAGTVVGYTRIRSGDVRFFLAASTETARLMAAQIGAGQEALTLPLHPYSASVAAFEKVRHEAWEAGMARSLSADTPFDEYYARLRSGARLSGRPVWGTAFDLA